MPNEDISPGEVTTVSFSVKDLVDPHSVMLLEKALDCAPGVESASVSMAAQTAHIYFDRTCISREALRKLIANAGFEAVEQTFSAQKSRPEP